MKTNITLTLIINIILGTQISFAQLEIKDPLFETLKVNDSLLFERSFNNFEFVHLENLIDEDLEFYHDQGGITDSKKEFIEGMKGFVNLPYKPIRELEKGSLEVFPLYNNGVLYGAIQKGVHHFYGLEKDKPKYLTSSAKFTHLWILKEGEWQLKRVLSYDHQSPVSKKD